jgi:hypothetical protein
MILQTLESSMDYIEDDVNVPTLDTFKLAAADLVTEMERFKMERIMKDDDDHKKAKDETIASILGVRDDIDSTMDMIAKLNKRLLEKSIDSYDQSDGEEDRGVINSTVMSTSCSSPGAGEDSFIDDEPDEEETSEHEAAAAVAVARKPRPVAPDDNHFGDEDADDEGEEDIYLKPHMRVGRSAAQVRAKGHAVYSRVPTTYKRSNEHECFHISLFCI